MTRYIDADKFMEIVKQHEYLLATVNNSRDYGMFTLGIQEAIDKTPTADVQEVKHGKWNQMGCPKYVYVCSKCGRTIECWSEPENRFPYCHCGARMDGDEK